jgi:3-dehydroquinate synthase
VTSEPIRLRFNGGRECVVHVGGVEELGAHWRAEWREAALIGDARVMALYGEAVAARLRVVAARVEQLDFPAGDVHKTRATKERLEDELSTRGLGRELCVVALGGGVSLDVAGFVAATYLRGVPHVNLPTSLLAQVDAAVGGKTGVNTPQGKNLIGAFHQPAVVLVDRDFLRTLPAPEWRNGLAEMVKLAVVADAALFEWIAARTEALRAPGAIDEHPLRRCLEIKAAIVGEDERESGRRSVLNFGHTFGHAIEHALEHSVSHGAAVAMGMILEARVARALGTFGEEDGQRLERCLDELGLPTRRPALCFDRLTPFLATDKKRRAGELRMSLPVHLGEAPATPRPVTMELARRVWDAAPIEEGAIEVASAEPGDPLCLTGGERTVEEVARRLREHPAALHEVRLDLLAPFDDAIYPLLRSPRVIVTCRPAVQGGRFGGSEGERRVILLRALQQRPGYVDVELEASEELRREIWTGRGATRLILSLHRYDASPWTSEAEELGRQPADLLKLAVAIEDPAELASLRSTLAGQRRPVLRIGMGAAGVLSRALPSRFGSPWSYVSEGGEPIAPGQLSLATARSWRVAEERGLTPLGLLGGAQVATSPGPRVYNRLFSERGLPFLYLPVATTRPVETLDLLDALGFAGCSVTMPAKTAVAARVDELRDSAARVGAVNTVVFEVGADGRRRRIGSNTDVVAVRELLRDEAGRRALVLGAGGAARAAVVGLQELGCAVTVSARTSARGAAVATALGAEVVDWEERGTRTFAILVNATPCGADDRGDPMPDGTSATVVLDMVLANDTPLLRRTRGAGGRAISGRQMWVAQGVPQVELLTGQRLTADDLAGALDG